MKISKITHLQQLLHKEVAEAIDWVDLFERIYNGSRHQGNTAELVKAAKRCNGLIVTHNEKFAEELRTLGVHAKRYTDPTIHSFTGPTFLDLPAFFELVKAHSRLQQSALNLLMFLEQKNIN